MGKELKKAIILVGIAWALLLTGCKEEEGIIPPAEMSALFAEFYLADAGVEKAQEDGSKEMRYVDSLRVYEPILEAHGYSKEAFRTSLNHYLHDPAKLTKIFQRTCTQLEALADQEVGQLDMEDAGEVDEPSGLPGPALMEGTEPEAEKPVEKTRPQRKMRKKMTRDELKQLEEELKKNNE